MYLTDTEGSRYRDNSLNLSMRKLKKATSYFFDRGYGNCITGVEDTMNKDSESYKSVICFEKAVYDSRLLKGILCIP